MIRVKILRGLDLATEDAELYLTLNLDGLSKTSKVTSREKADDGGSMSPSTSSTPPPIPVAAAQDETGAAPPAVKKELGTYESSSSTTRRELAWVWDEELDLSLPSRERKEEATVEVCCFDGAFKARGKVSIPVIRLAPNESVQQWYPLIETNPKAAVLLKLTFIPESSASAGPATGPSVTFEVQKSASNIPATSVSPADSKGLTASSTAPAPQTNDKSSISANQATAAVSSKELPMGIADYFMIAGCPMETARQERIKLLAKPRKKPISFNSNLPADEFSQTSVVGPDAVTINPVMLDRYPATDRKEVEFPTKAEMFVLPDGAEIVRQVPKHARKPRFFAFVLVTNGVRTYGFCMETFEPLPKRNKTTDFEDLYAPIVLCYLTRVPLRYADFRWILQKTHEARKSNWLERVVHHVVRSIPVPLPGILAVEFNLFSSATRTIQLPSPSDLPPLVFPGLCKHCFEWFPLNSMIDLWIAALTEQKILVHSHNREVLSVIAETLVQLMYPFKWENAYVPVLPTSLMQLFDAPIPCILGLRTDALKLINGGGGTEILEDNWIIINADECDVSFPKQDPLPNLPVELRARLFRTLRSIKANRKLSEAEKDRLLRLAFLECLASMLQGYRESFFVLSTDTDASTVFNRSQFFQRQSTQKLQQQAQMTSSFHIPNQSQVLGDGGRDFLDRFFDTTAFERFKVSQYDPETDFFHAVYASRRARERERDQRSAALAALRGEAEAATTSSNATAAAAAAPGPVTTTIVKIWNARDSRWNVVGLQPIEPPSKPSDASKPPKPNGWTIAHVKVATPLNIGELVYCKPYGPGRIERIELHCVVVRMTWGALAYLQEDVICRYIEPQSTGVASGTSPRSSQVKSIISKTSSISTDASAAGTASLLQEEEDEEEAQDEDEEPLSDDDDGTKIKEELLPVKTRPEFFDSRSVPDMSHVVPLMDGESLRKALTHFNRTLGIVGVPNQSQQVNVANPRRTNSRSANDLKLERILNRAIMNVFSDKAVSDTDLRDCSTNLYNSQFARDLLVYVLKSQQSSGKEASWLATPGRGRRLGSDAFTSLYEMFDALLKACAAKEDFTNGRCALEVSGFYCCEDETLQSKLRGHTLWSKPMFWEYAFAEQFALEMDGSKAVPEPPTPNADITAMESPSAALARFHEIGNKCEEKDLEAHKQKLFEGLSIFLHTMLILDVSEEMVRVFVDRVANVYSLEDHKIILSELISNISKALSYHSEEERAQQAQIDGSVSGSPNSSSKRHIRKHYSVEAVTNTMLARFGWKRTNKVKSPNSTVGVGRRDSQTSQETN